MDDFILRIVDAFVLLLVAIFVNCAYRLGHANGRIHGAVAERERRDAEDLRISRVTARIEAGLNRDEFTEEEIDT